MILARIDGHATSSFCDPSLKGQTIVLCTPVDENGEATGVVELPVEWVKDDAVYFNMERFSGLRPYTPPSAVLEIFKAEFDGAYADGGLFLLTMHPHFIGHRSRIRVLEQLVRYIRSHSDVWFATHADIARYCREQAGM